MLIAGLIILGLLAGAISGAFGVGGAVLVIPALVYVFGFSQKTAQGTSLALLLPPIGAFAAYNYYKVGAVDFKAALYIIIGFLVGSFIVSRYAVHMQSADITRLFAIFLLLVAIKMLATA